MSTTCANNVLGGNKVARLAPDLLMWAADAGLLETTMAFLEQPSTPGLTWRVEGTARPLLNTSTSPAPERQTSSELLGIGVTPPDHRVEVEGFLHLGRCVDLQIRVGQGVRDDGQAPRGQFCRTPTLVSSEEEALA
jgi:hypothetical protein